MVSKKYILALMTIASVSAVSGTQSFTGNQTWWTRTLNHAGVNAYSTPHYGLKIDGLRKTFVSAQDLYTSQLNSAFVESLVDFVHDDVRSLNAGVKNIALSIAGLRLSLANADARLATLAGKMETRVKAQESFNAKAVQAFGALAEQVGQLQSTVRRAIPVDAVQVASVPVVRSFGLKHGLMGCAATVAAGALYGYYNMKQEIKRLQEQATLLQAQEASHMHRMNVAAGCGLGVIGIVGGVMLYQQYQVYKTSQKNAKKA